MIIVGAGVIGLSCAWRLSQRGVRVRVFDRREAGREASWAAAGMLAPSGEYEQETEAARLAVRSLAAFPSFVAEVAGESGRRIDLRFCGAVEVAFDDAEASALQRRAGARALWGIESEEARWEAMAAARFYPGDGMVDPRELTAALRRACVLAGVVFHECEKVVRVSKEGEVVTERETYRDDAVLMAAGAWTFALLPDGVAAPRVYPVRGHMLAFNMAPGTLGPILRNAHTYLLQRANGTLVVGATSECAGFHAGLNEAALEELRGRAERLLPALTGLNPTARWNGFRPGIDADAPLIGHLGGKLWGAFGHYRNGILMAPETARMVVDMLGA